MKRTQCRCFSSLVSAAISTHRPPFLALMDSRSSHNAKSEQQSKWLAVGGNPRHGPQGHGHIACMTVFPILAPRAIYLPLVFVFPASNVSFLLPLNLSVNFQKPVKSPHWPHGGGGGQSSSSLLQSIQLMVHETLLVVEKTQRLQIPPVHLHSTWKNKQRWFFCFFYKLQPKLNYFLLSSS